MTKVNRIIGVIILVGLGCLLLACSTEFDVNTDNDPQLVVYCHVDPTDSFCYVTLSKSFQTFSDANAVFNDQKIMKINNAEINLEAWGEGYKAWNTDFSLIDSLPFPSSDLIHARSIYKSNKILGFQDASTHGSSTPWIYEDLRLIITTPDFNKIIYSKVPIITAPRIIFPVTTMSVNLYGSEKSYFEFDVDQQEAKYADFICDFYFEEFSDKWSPRMVRLVLKKNLSIINDPIIRLYDDSFFNKLVIAIGDNPEVAARRFRYMDFSLNVSDIYFDTYYSISNSSYNNDYTFYSNITNGMGFFSVKRKAVIKKLVFDEITYDSLRGSQKTRHLNFRLW